MAMRLWREIDDITTSFVYEYDIVPRLPPCRRKWRELNWFGTLGTVGGFLTGWDLSKSLLDFKPDRERYETIGTLVFLSSTSKPRRLKTSLQKSHHDVLFLEPPKQVRILTGNNSISGYVSAALE